MISFVEKTSHKIALFFFSFFLLIAPLWVPHSQKLWNHNLFITVHGMMWLGASILGGLLFIYILPSAFLEKSEKGIQWVGRSLPSLAPLFFGALVFALYEINQQILHAFLSSADEHSCYFLAECIRLGKWWVKPHELSDFFNTVHVGNRGGKWFSVYPYGWPLIWAGGLQYGIVDWLNPMLSAAALFFFYLAFKRLFGKNIAWTAIFLTALSPFFLFTSASYFSHSTCLFTIGLFLYAFLRWKDAQSDNGLGTPSKSTRFSTGNEPRTFGRGTEELIWAAVAACAFGYGLATRYLTMFAIAVPFLAVHYWPLFFQKKRWRKGDILFIIITGLFVLSILYQNWQITGKPFRAPNKHDKSWERLGFRSNYTIIDGLFYIVARFFYLADWFAPGLLFIFLISFFKRKQDSVLKRLLRLGFFYPVLAYFFYYSWGGNQFGPRYYYEGFPFLLVTVTFTAAWVWKYGKDPLKKFLFGVILISLFANANLFCKQAEFQEEASRQRKELYVLAEQTVKNPSIVFIRGFLGSRLVMAEGDAVRNHPLLTGRILYAHDLAEKNNLLQKAYPDREYYLGYYDATAKKAVLEKI